MPESRVEALPRPTRDLERLKGDMDRHGYCLIEQALDADQLAALRDRITAQAKAEREQGFEFLDQAEEAANGNQWVYLLINKGRVFRDLLVHPEARQILDHVLGPHHLLSSMSAHITHPGGALMGLHTDQWWMPQPTAPGEDHIRAGAITRADRLSGDPSPAAVPISPPVKVNIMWYLVDFTVANGATRVVPGSHLSGRQPETLAPQGLPLAVAEAPAGTALLWDGRTWHAAGLNVSNGPRYGVQTAFIGPQFRSMENYTLGTRPEVLAELTDDLKRLLGFGLWSGYGKTGDPQAAFAKPGAEEIGELG